MTNLVVVILVVAVVGAVLLRLAIKSEILQAALKLGVGQKALAALPDQIHLLPKPAHRWSNPAKFTALSEPLRPLGFSVVGTYAARELPGTVIALYGHLAERVAGTIYDHPQAGVWLNFYSHYRDGRRVTASTQAASGLDPMPGATTIHAPGATTSALYERFLRERPKDGLEDMTPLNVAAHFEAAYASEMAWRKQKGVSAKELSRQIDKRSIKIQFSVK